LDFGFWILKVLLFGSFRNLNVPGLNPIGIKEGDRRLVVGLLSLLICGGISMAPVEAQESRRNLRVDAAPNQTYLSLMQEAESLAKRAIAEAFASDRNLTEVTVRVIGERNGQVVPLLTTEVSRRDWERTPQISLWTRYYGSAEILLGFLELEESEPPPARTNSRQRSPEPDFGDGRGFDDEYD
jgi:hypothetical protein